TTPQPFFSTNIVANLAALLGVTVDKIRRVDVVSANGRTRIQRRSASSSRSLLATYYLEVQIRE
ncbi:unnamed protein product, partial [Rotaria socialis]